MFSFLKEKITKENVSKVLKNAFWFILSVLLGRCSFVLDTVPFGLALSGAATKNTIAIYTGVFLASLFNEKNPIAYVLVIIFSFVLRMYVSSGKMNEPEKKRMLAIGFSAALLSVEDILIVGISFNTLISAAVNLVFTLLFGFLFCLYFSQNEKFLPLYEAGYLSLFFCAVYSLNTLEFFGLSPAVIIAYYITCLVSMKHGFMKGGITGIICGLACGAFAYVYSPILGILGIVCGVFFNFSDALAMCCVLFISIVYGMYAADMSTVSSIFKNAVIVIISFSPVVFALKRYRFFKKSSEELVCDLAIPTFTGATASNDRIDKLSKTYKELSDMFTVMGRHQISPSAVELGDIIKKAMLQNCNECSHVGKCSKRKECLKAIIELSKKYLQNLSEIPISKVSRLPTECRENATLIPRINELFNELIEEKTEKDSCSETARNMLNISKALSAAIDKDNELVPNPEIASKVSKVLASMRIRNSGVYAQGKEGVGVLVYDVRPKDLNVGVKELSRIISEECKICFSAPRLTYDGKQYTLHFSRSPKIKISRASVQLCKGSNTICGDSSTGFYTPSQYINLICDGMGSGAEAAATSRTASISLQKLISSGCGIKLALETVNKILQSKFDEVFTTLDFLAINIFTSDAVCYKAAAAPTYVIRNGKSYEITSKSVPVGIVDEFNPELTKIKLSPKDAVIMLSDGASDCIGADKLCEIVDKNRDKSAQKITDEIIIKIKESQKLCDDATVVCLLIDKFCEENK